MTTPFDGDPTFAPPTPPPPLENPLMSPPQTQQTQAPAQPQTPAQPAGSPAAPGQGQTPADNTHTDVQNDVQSDVEDTAQTAAQNTASTDTLDPWTPRPGDSTYQAPPQDAAPGPAVTPPPPAPTAQTGPVAQPSPQLPDLSTFGAPASTIGTDPNAEATTVPAPQIRSGWKLGDPVVRDTTLPGERRPPVTERAPGTTAGGESRVSIPGIPVYPMPDMLPDREPPRDRYGRYVLPDPYSGNEMAFTRATTLAKALKDGDQSGLTKWRTRTMLRGLIENPEILDGLDVSKLGTAKQWEIHGDLVRAGEAAMEAAGSADGREFGTAVHAWTEAVDQGYVTLNEVPEIFKEHIASYLTALSRAGVTVPPGMCERIVYVPLTPDFAVVGTLDRVYQLSEDEGSRLVIGDLKTSSNFSYALLETSTQLGLYARATHMWNFEAQRWEPMVPVDPNVGLVFNLPHTPKEDEYVKCDALTLNLAVGRDSINLALAVREARKRAGREVLVGSLNMDSYTGEDAIGMVASGQLPEYTGLPQGPYQNVREIPLQYDMGVYPIDQHPDDNVKQWGAFLLTATAEQIMQYRDTFATLPMVVSTTAANRYAELTGQSLWA